MHKKHKTKEWFKTTFSYKESILPRVIYRALFCAVFAMGISYLDNKGYDVQLPVLASVVPSVVIGLLLVFRTNTAYERFWEGRKLWSNIETLIRNISRQILVIVKEKNDEDKVSKKQALLLLAAFSISVRQRLEKKSDLLEIQNYLQKKEAEQIALSKNIPADILFFCKTIYKHSSTKKILL
jgi:ion channel-forming bestrophin family protein